MYTCTDKSRDGNKIIGYTLYDPEVGYTFVKSQELKNAIFNNKVQVNNLKLTSDGRLIDCKPEESYANNPGQIITITSKQEGDNLIDTMVDYIVRISPKSFNDIALNNKKPLGISKDTLDFDDWHKSSRKPRAWDVLAGFKYIASSCQVNKTISSYHHCYVNVNGNTESFPSLNITLSKYDLNTKKRTLTPELNEAVIADVKKLEATDNEGDIILSVAIAAKLSRNTSYGENSAPYVDYTAYIGYDIIYEAEKGKANPKSYNHNPIIETAYTKALADRINAILDVSELDFYKLLMDQCAKGRTPYEYRGSTSNYIKEDFSAIKHELNNSRLYMLKNAKSVKNSSKKLAELRSLIGIKLLTALFSGISSKQGNGALQVDNKGLQQSIHDGANVEFLNRDQMYQDGIDRAKQSIAKTENNSTFNQKASKGGLMGAFKRS